jgi:hypothetical protein
MMSDTHTTGPWKLNFYKVFTYGICYFVNEITSVVTKNPDDARRIVAAVNYCDGISTIYLETNTAATADANALLKQNAMLKRKNEDLVLGLRQLLEDCKLSKRLANTAIYVQGLIAKHEENDE